MDDSEYYAMMRRQYSSPIRIQKKKHDSAETKNETKKQEGITPGTFSEWSKKYGHEDAEMFYERNNEE
ncbi:MAG: hypothetical protein MST12_00935 [Spirochaetia bacterium]|uniref:hypothetical protein n=1 Tax=Treponema sp. TaxID=166 RepID=UPI00298E4A26|nr:hypothetical protein [Treponema sp.]MCI7397683.1 hypothetical protein [Spirochaetia bacterium]MCI7576805.1 hypothetical protein [Spirochaetia bacterium]